MSNLYEIIDANEVAILLVARYPRRPVTRLDERLGRSRFGKVDHPGPGFRGVMYE